uniref:CD36 family protein n=1 Tax=Parastrongyloides trichosuri TaxID=131310 RepID=A0A0N4ZVG7_PARTI
MDYLGRDNKGKLNNMTELWKNPTYNMSTQFFIFSLENLEDVYNKGAKPILREIGPFHFHEKQFKNNIKFLINDTRLEYENIRTYFFNSSLSCKECKLDKHVIIPSVVFQKIISMVNGKIIERVVDNFMSYNKLTPFINVTIGEVLFEGYRDPILKFICSKPILEEICRVLNVDEKIGFFYNKNGTSDGVYTIGTGKENRNLLSHIYGWNNMYGKLNETYWFGSEARIIGDTDGQLHPPKVDSSKPIKIFTGQACRSIIFDFVKKNNFDGVNSYMFNTSKLMLDMAEERRKGFCNPSTPRYFNSTDIQLDGCPPNGLMDLSGCVQNASNIYISAPYFGLSPQELRDKFIGIKNDSNDYNTYIELEPDTGVIIHAESRSQINLGMNNKKFPSTSKQDNLIFPILYMKESIVMDSNTRDQLIHGISYYTSISLFMGILCLFTACVLFAIGVWLYFRGKPTEEVDTNSDTHNLIENEETEHTDSII